MNGIQNVDDEISLIFGGLVSRGFFDEDRRRYVFKGIIPSKTGISAISGPIKEIKGNRIKKIDAFYTKPDGSNVLIRTVAVNGDGVILCSASEDSAGCPVCVIVEYEKP